MKGLVLKKNAGLYEVDAGESAVTIKASGKVKKQGLYVGDSVEFQEVINKTLPRKNLLIRPPLANLDKLFIVISTLPKPDLVLVDKLILYCYENSITPVLVINKTDLCEQAFIQEIKSIYKNTGIKILTSCHCEKGATEIENQIKGICAFAGQSAVGKSSLINSLLSQQAAQVGSLSKKLAVGKQTTRMTTLYKVQNGYIADTAGFSLLDAALVLDMKPNELSRYYYDFLDYIKNCKFLDCLHQNASHCGIIEAVNSGKINKIRYQNYLKILNELKENGRKV